jgi:hypothetical protein
MNLLSRRARHDDETGSMAVYLMIAIMGLAIGALLVPMVISQTRSTRLDTSRVHAVDAAHAGIDAMLGQIRASVVAGVGTSSMLPCTEASGDLVGTVNGSDDAAYSVSIDYYMADPVATPSTVKMRCVPRYGPYDPVTDNFTPKFARITSTGTDGAAFNGSTDGRTLVTTYIFRTTNSNIPGGRMRLYPASGSSAQLCMDGTTATPTAGTIVKLQTCTDPLAAQQVFAYRSDLTIQLLSSITGTYVNGLCLDTAAPPASTKPVILGICQPLNSPPYTQQWSFNDDGHLEASRSTSVTDGSLSGMCMNAASQNAGINVTVETCSGSTGSPTQAWIPAPSVGAGAAEAPQLINYYEFGRCLDVTNQNVDEDHLIDFPCKQNPNPTAVRWNQKFVTPGFAAAASSAVGRIVTTPPSGVLNCLTSPGTAGGLVVVDPCNGSSSQVWTVYNGNSSLSYSVKYTIVDSGGRCLGLTDPVGSEAWSSVDVEACNGATEHKWNATANLNSSVLQDLDEIPTP